MARYGDFGDSRTSVSDVIIRFYYKKLLINIAIFKHERSLGRV